MGIIEVRDLVANKNFNTVVTLSAFNQREPKQHINTAGIDDYRRFGQALLRALNEEN